MTVNDLPERLRHLGGQAVVTGEIVHVLISEREWKGWETLLLEIDKTNTYKEESA